MGVYEALLRTRKKFVAKNFYSRSNDIYARANGLRNGGDYDTDNNNNKINLITIEVNASFNYNGNKVTYNYVGVFSLNRFST